MKRPSYSELLKDPRWQKKRLEILEYAQWRCQICGRKDRTLHVHHSYYTNGKKPWQYPNGSMIAVCEPHHEMIHPKIADRKREQEEQARAIEYSPPPEHASTESRFAAMRRMLMEDQSEP